MIATAGFPTRCARLAGLFLFSFLLVGCALRPVRPVEPGGNGPTPAPAGSASSSPPPAGPVSPLPAADAQRIIEARARDTVAALKRQDMKKLAEVVHPKKGLRLSPYASVRPGAGGDVVLSRAEVEGALAEKAVRRWGHYDGRGDPIVLPFADYYERFVYDVDFAAAPQVSYNRPIGQGNTVDNSAEVYPGAIVVEYHFPGFEKKYEGMDWRSLRLVFEREGDAWYLVGIIHAQWTI